MISILIPVYNVDVRFLVHELSKQLIENKLKGEILVYDDFSDTFYRNENASISFIDNVVYKQLEKNYGRIGIRKFLSQGAKHPWLLFIDSDSIILKSDYLTHYYKCLTKGYDVYVGGTTYQQEKPSDCSKILHWKYGIARESISHTLRSNNFLIAKEIFSKLNFPESLMGYGHEDTWIQIELQKKNKKILLINNPVQHAGLEATPIFLEKSRNALRNLLALSEIEGREEIRKTVALYKLYLFLLKFGLISFARNMLQKRITKITENLNSCNPSLFQFDLYRLCFLMEFANEKKEGR